MIEIKICLLFLLFYFILLFLFNLFEVTLEATAGVGGEFPSRMREFKFLIIAGSLVQHYMYCRCSIGSMWGKEKTLNITLTYGHELWVVTKRMRSWIQMARISFIHGMTGALPERSRGSSEKSRSSQ